MQLETQYLIYNKQRLVAIRSQMNKLHVSTAIHINSILILS
jgi:hypothetical protein